MEVTLAKIVTTARSVTACINHSIDVKIEGPPYSNCYEIITSPSSEALVANVAVCCYLIISLLGLNFVLDNFFQWRHSSKQGSEKNEILIFDRGGFTASLRVQNKKLCCLNTMLP